MIRFVRKRRMNGGLSMPSIDDEQLVQRELAAAAAHHPGEDALVDDVADLLHPRRVRRARLRRALLEHPLAPRARLDDRGRRSG